MMTDLFILQPENILLNNDNKFPEIRLIDFGLSRRVDLPYSQYDIVGTPEYVGEYLYAVLRESHS